MKRAGRRLRLSMRCEAASGGSSLPLGDVRMGLRFTVLASGSGGNATLVECDGFGLLIDAGLGPRQLATRLTAAGASWSSVHALLLTHTHSDHWNDNTIGHLMRRRIPLYCHPGHHRVLE